jgi:chemotaxis protein histidine kinase CheA
VVAFDPEARLDALYRVPPEDFVATRDALVRDLRAAKRREEAAAVKTLARPGPALWAANAAARARPDLVEALEIAGTALIAAQRAAFEHGDASGLRAALAARRTSAGALTEAAGAVLAAAGRATAGTAGDLAALFDAVALDRTACERLRAGRLDKVPDVAANAELLGGFAASPGAPARRTAPKRAGTAPATEPDAPVPDTATPEPARAAAAPAAAEPSTAASAESAAAAAPDATAEAAQRAQRKVLDGARVEVEILAAQVTASGEAVAAAQDAVEAAATTVAAREAALTAARAELALVEYELAAAVAALELAVAAATDARTRLAGQGGDGTAR